MLDWTTVLRRQTAVSKLRSGISQFARGGHAVLTAVLAAVSTADARRWRASQVMIEIIIVAVMIEIQEPPT